MNVCDQTMATCMGPNGFSHLTHLLEHNCALINHLPQIINNTIYKHDFFISCFRILNLSLPQSPHKGRVETDKLQGMKKMFYDCLFS